AALTRARFKIVMTVLRMGWQEGVGQSCYGLTGESSSSPSLTTTVIRTAAIRAATNHAGPIPAASASPSTAEPARLASTGAADATTGADTSDVATNADNAI